MAVMTLADIAVVRSIRVAGDEMDAAIIAYMRRKHDLMVGQQTAERVKIQIGSAIPLDEELKMEVRGRDVVAGLPRLERPAAKRNSTPSTTCPRPSITTGADWRFAGVKSSFAVIV